MPEAIYEVFPAIGIARLGNAPAAFYIGPELGGGLPILADGSGRVFGPADFRDAEGRLQRQAARFRIFRRSGEGAAEEVTLDTSGVREIRWSAHLANKKASWYRFQTTKGQHGYGPNHPLRNAAAAGIEERRRLNIDPGPRKIAGRDGGPVEFSRSTIPAGYAGGGFPPAILKPQGIDTLGALRTDAAGRLLLLGGFGRSGSLGDSPALGDYANNDGWWDDIADGPVRATILLANGETIEAKPAWALVAPPAFAPQIANLVTLDDLMFDTAVRFLGARPDIHDQGFWKAGAQGYRPHFESEIAPILRRGEGYPWVTDIPAGPHGFDMEKLADPGPGSADLRKFYLDILRGPGEENLIDSRVPKVSMMPLLLGDDAIAAEQKAGVALATSKYLSLTDTQYFFLQQWAAGHFETAAAGRRDPGESLTRAVLENCVGGPLSPGIETTWIVRDPAIYAEPFRLRVKSPLPQPLSLGFDPAEGLEPGDLTRYMALPWQADFNECATQQIEGRLLWWWPAQRPISVFLADEATGAPGRQVPWIGSDDDPAAADYFTFGDHMEMLRDWDKLGFVMDLGKNGKPQFVEVSRKLPHPPAKPKK
jgi:hypothetical protein